ncbi:MAG: hypothetical protein ABMA14_21545, partial [Hyphomonadaceae bacterium]
MMPRSRVSKTKAPRMGAQGVWTPLVALAMLSACAVAAPALSQQSPAPTASIDFDAAMRGLNFNPGST